MNWQTWSEVPSGFQSVVLNLLEAEGYEVQADIEERAAGTEMASDLGVNAAGTNIGYGALIDADRLYLTGVMSAIDWLRGVSGSEEAGAAPWDTIAPEVREAVAYALVAEEARRTKAAKRGTIQALLIKDALVRLAKASGMGGSGFEAGVTGGLLSGFQTRDAAVVALALARAHLRVENEGATADAH
jgi:hypothetical protein